LPSEFFYEWISDWIEFTNELSFITLVEPNRGRHTEQLVVILPLSRECLC
jgi:hypothetical protein